MEVGQIGLDARGRVAIALRASVRCASRFGVTFEAEATAAANAVVEGCRGCAISQSVTKSSAGT